jgi:hypothetical protein
MPFEALASGRIFFLDERDRAIGRSLLRPLRQHPIRRLEVFPGKSDELPVAWMIHGLHADNGVHHLGIALLNVFDQFRLCIGRSRNENLPGVRNGFRDGLKKVVIGCGVSTADGVRLVMDMPGRMIRMQSELLYVGRAEMKYAGLMVIDPYDGVIVMLVHK